MKRFTLILSLLVAMVTTAMAQLNDGRIKNVTALNEASYASNNREGGVTYIKDGTNKTFYHSDWGSSYEGRTAKKGGDGLQAFMVELDEVHTDINQLAYAGRSDDNASGWATRVRIYMYENLPDGLNSDLSTLGYEEKEELLKREDNTVLGEPAFDNNSAAWANDRRLKIINFDTPKTAKYILFVMDAGVDQWLTCSQFNIYCGEEKAIEHYKPYFLKITGNAGAEGDWYLDIRTNRGGNMGGTISRSETPVPAYFVSTDGFYHISASPWPYNEFLKVNNWDATPMSATASDWDVIINDDASISLLQYEYTGNSGDDYHHLGKQDGANVYYTDKNRANAIKIELVELDELATAKENARLLLKKNGVGYPAIDSDVRNELQATMESATTADAVNTAIQAFTSAKDVVMPEVGKVYRIVSALTGFAERYKRKAMFSDITELKWGDYNANNQNQMWAVQSIDGSKIKFININDATYPQRSDFSNPVRALNKPNECTLEILGNGQFKIMANGLQGLHANGHASGNGNSGNIINYNTAAGEASAWYLEEVDVTQTILSKIATGIENTCLNSLVIKGSDNLQEAVATAKDATENYAVAMSNLMNALDGTTLEYIDLGYFYIKSKAGGKYAGNNNNEEINVTVDKTIKSIFKFINAGDGTFYVQTDGGRYAQSISTSVKLGLGENKVKYIVNRLSASDHYVLTPANATNSGHYWHDAGDDRLVGWSTDADNTRWTIEPLSDEEVSNIYTVEMVTDSDVTLTYTPDYTGTKNIVLSGGFYVLDAEPDESDFTASVVESIDPLTSSIKVNNKTISFINGYNGENIYIIRGVQRNAYARYHSGSTLSGTDNTNMLTYESNFSSRYESLFFIEKGTGNYEGYYTIRSVAAPSMYAYNLESVDRNSAVAMKEAPAEGGLTDAYYWKITSFGEEAGNITPYGADECGWNQRGSNGGYNHIGYWSGHNNDDNNKWYVRTIDDEFVPLYDVYDAVFGYATYESVEEYLPYAQIVSSDAFNRLKTAQFELVTPTQGAYYRLQNVASSNYMSGNKTNITLLTDGAEAASTVFYLAEGNMLLSYNSGQYLNCNGKNYVTIGQTPNSTKFGFAYGGSQENVLTYHSNGAWTYGAGADGAALDRGTGTPDQVGYNWTFAKVSSLPVTISEAKYATFYAPVEVTVPDKVEAYYVTTGGVNSTYITLTKIADGVVPANTGVILYAETADTYNLDITYTGAATIADNLLEGTVAATYVPKNAYVLSAPGGIENVGLYKATLNQEDGKSFLNNSHKAYLPAVAGSANVASYSFRFGEGTTGVDEITDNRVQSTGIYDLTGRRVEEITAPGIYVVNGKKVLVK